MNTFFQCGCSFVLIFCFLMPSCLGTSRYKLNLLPTPDVVSSGLINPFTEASPSETMPYRGMLYATSRYPSSPGNTDERFYSSRPGGIIRLGVGHIQMDVDDFSWDQARKISILKNRTQDYPLIVDTIEEFGCLDTSVGLFTEPPIKKKLSRDPAIHFAGLINQKLSISKVKDVFIYVHGYNTNFEDPLLVASELWHYIGYEGSFVAFSWPATERGAAYLGDTEKARLASRNLRLFLRYIAQETQAENIHIIGYSMGTRVTSDALSDFALIHSRENPIDVRSMLKLGNVILIGSDVSSYAFSSYLNDGILNMVQSLTLYTSDDDKALGASSWIFGINRMGQLTKKMPIPDYVKTYLWETPRLQAVDVSGAVDADDGNGHHYFRNSPWVSSDILMTLRYNIPPEKRGLKQGVDSPVWSFPENYIEEMQTALKSANPDLFSGLK